MANTDSARPKGIGSQRALLGSGAPFDTAGFVGRARGACVDPARGARRGYGSARAAHHCEEQGGFIMKQFMPIFAFAFLPILALAIALALILTATSPADAKPCGRGH